MAILAVALLAGVTVAATSGSRIRVQDRTVEQALVQLSGDAARQASYTGEGLSVDLFEEALTLPTSPEMFQQVVDGDLSPSEGYWQVAVTVSEDGTEAFLAVRGYSADRCIVGSVAANGTVRVSRAAQAEVCRPDATFVFEDDPALAAPSWRDGFVPSGAAGAGLVVVGWDAADVVVADGAPEVVSVTAFAQRTGGGTLSSCSTPYGPAGLSPGPDGTEFSCSIVALDAGVAYRVWLVAVDAAGGLSSPSAELTLTPTALPDGDVDVNGSSDGIVVTWTLDGSIVQSSYLPDDDASGILLVSGPDAPPGAGRLVQVQAQGMYFEVTRFRLAPDGSWTDPVKLPSIPYDPLRTEYSFTNSSSAGATLPVTQGAYYRYEVRLVDPSDPSNATLLQSREVASLAKPEVAEDVAVVARTVGGRGRQSMIVRWSPVTGANSYVVEFTRQPPNGAAPVVQRLVVPADATVAGSCPAQYRCAETPRSMLGRGEFSATVTASTASASDAPRDLSDADASDSKELVEEPAKPQLAVTVQGNRPRLAASSISDDTGVSYTLTRDGSALTGQCGSLGRGVSQCTDLQASAGRELSYVLTASAGPFEVASDPVTVTLLGRLQVDVSNRTRNGLTLSWSAAGASEYEVYACAASASRFNTDCPSGERGVRKPAGGQSTSASFVRAGAGQTGSGYNLDTSLTVWSVGCDSTNEQACPLTRFTVVARSASGAVLEETSGILRAIPQPAPRPSPAPAPAPAPYEPPPVVVAPNPRDNIGSPPPAGPRPAPTPPAVAPGCPPPSCVTRSATIRCGSETYVNRVRVCGDVPRWFNSCSKQFVPRWPFYTTVCTPVVIGTRRECNWVNQTGVRPKYCTSRWTDCTSRCA